MPIVLVLERQPHRQQPPLLIGEYLNDVAFKRQRRGAKDEAISVKSCSPVVSYSCESTAAEIFLPETENDPKELPDETVDATDGINNNNNNHRSKQLPLQLPSKPPETPPPMNEIECHLTSPLPIEISLLLDQFASIIPDFVEWDNDNENSSDSCTVQSDDLFSVSSRFLVISDKRSTKTTTTTNTTTWDPSNTAQSSKTVEFSLFSLPSDENPDLLDSSDKKDHRPSPDFAISANIPPPEPVLQVDMKTIAEENRPRLVVPFLPMSPRRRRRRSSSLSDSLLPPSIRASSAASYGTNQAWLLSCFQQADHGPEHNKAGSTTTTNSSNSSTFPPGNGSSSIELAEISDMTLPDPDENIHNEDISIFSSGSDLVSNCACCVETMNHMLLGDYDGDDLSSISAAATVALLDRDHWESEKRKSKYYFSKGLGSKEEDCCEFWSNYCRRMRLLTRVKQFAVRHRGLSCHFTIRIMDDDDQDGKVHATEFRIYETAGRLQPSPQIKGRILEVEPYLVLYGLSGFNEWMDRWVDFVEWFSSRAHWPIFDLWFNRLDMHINDVYANDAKEMLQQHFLVDI